MYGDFRAGIIFSGSPQPFFPFLAPLALVNVFLWPSFTPLAAKAFSLSDPQELCVPSYALVDTYYLSVLHEDIPVWPFHVLYVPLLPTWMSLCTLLISPVKTFMCLFSVSWTSVFLLSHVLTWFVPVCRLLWIFLSVLLVLHMDL